MSLLAVLSNPREIGLYMNPKRDVTPEERDLLRLARFPQVRTAISRALAKEPLKVYVSGPGGDFVRFTLQDAKKYRSFAVIVLAPKHLRGRSPKLARAALGTAGFSRLTLGVIGRKGPGSSELQAVLVPKVRVAKLAAKYLGKPVRKKAAMNPWYAVTEIGNAASTWKSKREYAEQDIAGMSVFEHPGLKEIKPGQLVRGPTGLPYHKKNPLTKEEFSDAVQYAKWHDKHGRNERAEGVRDAAWRYGMLGRDAKLGGFSENPRKGMNDRERELWVSNDEGLYNWWKSTRLPMREFINKNRAELTRIIEAALNKPPRPNPRTGPVTAAEKKWADAMLRRYSGFKSFDELVAARRHGYTPTMRFPGSAILRSMYLRATGTRAHGTQDYGVFPRKGMKNPTTYVVRDLYGKRDLATTPTAQQAHAYVEKVKSHYPEGALSVVGEQSRFNRNPSGVVDIPFKANGKYKPEQIERWVATQSAAVQERWVKAVAQYKRFHKGSLPSYVSFNIQKIGVSKNLTDVEFGISEGKEWMAPYQVPVHSGKYEGDGSDGRYVHAHGDSQIEVTIKKPASTKKLPERFHTADGGFVGVIPSKNVKITDWYRG
jgi:hypothetical protein